MTASQTDAQGMERREEGEYECSSTYVKLLHNVQHLKGCEATGVGRQLEHTYSATRRSNQMRSVQCVRTYGSVSTSRTKGLVQQIDSVRGPEDYEMCVSWHALTIAALVASVEQPIACRSILMDPLAMMRAKVLLRQW